MRGTRNDQDQAFWNVVQHLNWRLDDGGGVLPPDGTEFDHGGGGGGGRGPRAAVWPRWSTHVIAFLLGGMAWSCLIVAPPMWSVAALVGVVAVVGIAAKRRWR